MTTTHDNAAKWRDLADALTPEQIAYIEGWEAHPEIPPMADGSAAPPEDHAAALLFTAREFVEQNATGALYADVAPPPDQGVHYPWENIGDNTWTRFFTGTTRKLGDVEVSITGLQASDGTSTRNIGIHACDDLDATAARQVAALLIEAADELEQLQ